MNNNTSTEPQQGRCGYVGLVGRPNVGKSTLMNQCLGVKLSITASKPQTTRHQILGIKTVEQGQLVFVDTPGIHLDAKRAINRYMNRVARAVLADVQVVLWLLEANRFTDEDRHIGELLKQADGVVFAVVNKVDKAKDKASLLPFVEQLNKDYAPEAIFMISALKGDGVEEMETAILDALPFSAPYYSADEITDRSERFVAAEFIREQIARSTHAEIPFATTVEVEQYAIEGRMRRIGAVIWVEREGQKGIVIGKQGKSLKHIGTEARKNLESFFGDKVFLELWVKVKSRWSDDDRALRAFGYSD